MGQLSEDKVVYVQDEDNKLVYKVCDYDAYNNYITWSLELVAGWDYINPDYTDQQGWVSNNNFVQDVQFITVLQYMLEESFKEAVETNGLTVMENFNEANIRIR